MPARRRSLIPGWTRRLRISRRFIFLASILVTLAYLVFASPSHLNRKFTSLEIPGRDSWTSFLSSPEDPVIARGLVYDDDGRVKGWDALNEVGQDTGLSKKDRRMLLRLRGTHPIEELVKQGLKKWDDLLAR